MNGASQCVTFTGFGARPEYAALEAVSGTSQSLSVTAALAQIVLRVLDTDGNPMAGATVALYHALHAWTPPCAPLGTTAGTANSVVDGKVTFAPDSLPGGGHATPGAGHIGKYIHGKLRSRTASAKSWIAPNRVLRIPTVRDEKRESRESSLLCALRHSRYTPTPRH